MGTAKNVEIIPVGDPRRPDWIPAKNAQGWPLNVYIDEGCWREERWGQYVLPAWDPTKPGGHTGRGQTWQRATTFIGMAEYHGDGLADYRIRHALAGLVRRPDLLVRAARLWELPDKHFMEKEQQDALKEEWREIAAAAHEASGGDEASRNGTEVHAAIEHVNRGGTVDTLPTSIMIDGVEADLTVWRRHVEAYLDLRDGDNGFEVFPELVERVVNPDEDGTSGKFDLLALYQAPDALIDNLNVQRVKDGLEPLEYWTAPRFVVVDIKSGDTQYREKFSRQLYRYARADAYWIFEEDAYEDAPEDVCQDFGFVISVPWWEADPKVEMIPIPYGKVAINGTHACRQVKNARSLRLPTMKPVGLGYAPQEMKAPVVEEPAKKGGFKARNKRTETTVERADRIAVAEGRNDEADERDIQIANPSLGPDTARAIVAARELAPLAAGEGKKGCSVCHRVGHRRGSPKCLGENDPGLIKAAERSESFRQENEGPELPGDEPQWCRRTGACAGAGWTGPVKEGDSWVCGDCGLPSRAGQISGTGRPADPMATVEVNRDHPTKHPFEAFDGSSGRVCTRMVMLDDGSGDQCGATPAEHQVSSTAPAHHTQHQWTLDQESQTWVCAVGGESAAPEKVAQIEENGTLNIPEGVIVTEIDPDASVLDGHANDHPVKGELHVGPAAITGTDRFTDDFDPDCSTCDQGGHVCPGCGESIKHGQGDCGTGCTDDPFMTDEEYWLQLLVAAQSRANVIRVGQEAQKALGALTPALKEAGKAGLLKYPRIESA